MTKINIGQIKVYDPKQDGLDFRTYRAAYLFLNRLNKAAANALNEGIFHTLMQSEIEPGQSLDTFLNDPYVGYFLDRPAVFAVLFLNGHFHSKYSVDSCRAINLDNLAEGSNSIPFIVTRRQEADEFLKHPLFTRESAGVR